MVLTKDKKDRIVVPDSFPIIDLNMLQTGDILLFYYGNKLTEWHGRNRRKEFERATLPPYHTAIVAEHTKYNTVILDPELTTNLSYITEYTKKSSVRIDVLRYDATPEQRVHILSEINILAEKENIYDWKGFIYFSSQMPFLNWLKIIKPSKSTFFCSDAAVYIVQKQVGIQVSPRDHNTSAPVDLLLYGMRYHTMYTLKNRGNVL